jgi:hypothetical protein
MAVSAAISLGLDFSPGHAFAKEIWLLSRRSVHPSSGSGFFTLVASFGRASFHLDEDSVSLALVAAVGGYCDDLRVSFLRDRSYSFRVSSQQVGFMIYARKFYSCPHFKCSFHLWGKGGPNWHREFSQWE